MISSALHKSYGKLVHSGIQRIRDGDSLSRGMSRDVVVVMRWRRNREEPPLLPTNT